MTQEMTSGFRIHQRRGWWWAGVGSLSVHGTLILLAARLSAMGLDKPPLEIEVDVFDKSTVPEPDVPVPLDPEAPAPPVAVRPATRPRERPVPLPPPLASREAPSHATPRPVFGVAVESVVPGDSPVTVSVGNSLTTRDRAPGPAMPYATAPRQSGFSPEATDQIATPAELIGDVEAVYPVQAERDAIEGNVVLDVEVDREGKVRLVKLLTRAGYGMDENAMRAMWKMRFKPARDRNGVAVDSTIKHKVHFQPAKSEPEELP